VGIRIEPKSRARVFRVVGGVLALLILVYLLADWIRVMR
jgi:hypothetical protein